MITFGGRHLNTYKAMPNTYKGGEMEWRTDPSTIKTIKPKSTSEDIKSATDVITPESQSISDVITPASQSISDVITPATQAITDTVKPATKSIKPIIVEVKSESVTIDGPGLFDTNEISENQEISEAIPNIDTELFDKKASQLTSEEVYEHHKKNRRALIETSWMSILFGKTVGYIAHFIFVLIVIIFNLFILLIIAIIGIVLYKIIQKSLDASHLVLGGVGDTMQQVVDGAVIPGFSIMGITIPDIKLLGFLQGPTDEIKGAKALVPEKAWQVIVAMLKSFWNSITNPDINIDFDFSMFD